MTDNEFCKLIANYFYPRQDTIAVRMERNGSCCRIYATNIEQPALGAAVLAFRQRTILRTWGRTEDGEVFVSYNESEVSA